MCWLHHRYKPKDLTELIQPTANGTAHLAAAADPAAAAAHPAEPSTLQYIKVQGTCTVSLAPDATTSITQEVPLTIVRYFPFRKELPTEILQLLQPSLQELRDAEQQEVQRETEALAAGRSYSRKPHKWTGPPLWWIPFELLFKEGRETGSSGRVQQGQQGQGADAAVLGRLGWVGGICLYEFPSLSTQQQQQQQCAAAQNHGALRQQQQLQQAYWQEQQQQQVAGWADPAFG
jgi:hypothetical protein